MKIAFFSLAILAALTIVGAGAFLIGYQQFERSLLASSRSPQRLEQEIIQLETERGLLQRQVSDLQDQLKAGIKNQADASRTVVALEATIVELRRELEQAREAAAETDAR